MKAKGDPECTRDFDGPGWTKQFGLFEFLPYAGINRIRFNGSTRDLIESFDPGPSCLRRIRRPEE